MNPRARYTTILRDPVDQFKSAFHFFGCMRYMRTRIKTPGDVYQGMDKFLASPNNLWNTFPRDNCKLYIKNGQWFDLSDNPSIHTNRALINSTLRILDDYL